MYKLVRIGDVLMTGKVSVEIGSAGAGDCRGVVASPTASYLAAENVLPVLGVLVVDWLPYVVLC